MDSEGTTGSTPLSMTSVCFSYRSAGKDVAVLDDVSLALAAGEWVAVMGVSGSGKSTLLQCAAGLLRVASGQIEVDGMNVVGASERELTALRRTRVGFVFQDFNLVPALTAEQNVGLPARLGGVRLPQAQLLDALKRVGLAGSAGARPHELSGGERQRVAIARALISGPQVVFADEPTGSLDARSGARVLKEMRGVVNAGAAMMMVTHDPSVASQADRVLWLMKGTIVGSTEGGSVHTISRQLAEFEDDLW